jgi:hypothetical protein
MCELTLTAAACQQFAARSELVRRHFCQFPLTNFRLETSDFAAQITHFQRICKPFTAWSNFIC